jgi:hypothetical protein
MSTRSEAPEIGLAGSAGLPRVWTWASTPDIHLRVTGSRRCPDCAGLCWL